MSETQSQVGVEAWGGVVGRMERPSRESLTVAP